MKLKTNSKLLSSVSRLGVGMAMMALASSCVIGGVYGHYTQSGNVGDTSRVAKWSVTPSWNKEVDNKKILSIPLYNFHPGVPNVIHVPLFTGSESNETGYKAYSVNSELSDNDINLDCGYYSGSNWVSMKSDTNITWLLNQFSLAIVNDTDPESTNYHPVNYCLVGDLSWPLDTVNNQKDTAIADLAQSNNLYIKITIDNYHAEQVD